MHLFQQYVHHIIITHDSIRINICKIVSRTSLNNTFSFIATNHQPESQNKYCIEKANNKLYCTTVRVLEIIEIELQIFVRYTVTEVLLQETIRHAHICRKLFRCCHCSWSNERLTPRKTNATCRQLQMRLKINNHFSLCCYCCCKFLAFTCHTKSIYNKMQYLQSLND